MKNEARALYFWKTFGEWRRVISLDIDFKLIKSNIWTTSKWIVRFIYRDLVLRLLVPCTVVFTGDLLAMPARHAMLQKGTRCVCMCVWAWPILISCCPYSIDHRQEHSAAALLWLQFFEPHKILFLTLQRLSAATAVRIAFMFLY